MTHPDRRAGALPGRPVPVEIGGFVSGDDTQRGRVQVVAMPNGDYALLVTGSLTATIDTTGLATEATLATLLTEATFAAEDFATQTTLEAIRVLLSAIDVDTSNLDVALSTLGTEATLASVLAALSATLTVNVTDRAARRLGRVSGEPTHTRFDYVARTDSQPVYLGSADPGTATSAVSWKVTKFAYESGADDARMTAFDVREPMAWDNRTDPTIDGLAAWTF